MSRDDAIEKSYRAGSGEQPSAAADATILALARAAADDTRAAAASGAQASALQGSGSATSPRPTAQLSLLRRWRAPLGLAASLVLAVGIVSRVQVEEEAGTAPGTLPVAEAPAAPPEVPPTTPGAASPAKQAAERRAADNAVAVEPAQAKPAKTTQEMAKQDAAKQEATKQVAESKAAAPAPNTPSAFPAQARDDATPVQRAAKPEATPQRKALADGTASVDSSAAPAAAVRNETASEVRPAEELKRGPSALSSGAGSTAGAVGAAPQTMAAPAAAPPLPATAAAAPAPVARMASPAVSGEARRDESARSRAAGVTQGALSATAHLALGEAIEITLTPEQWLGRIIEARRAGRDEEADASLKRYVAKYPAQAIPPEARRAGGR